MSNPSLTGNVAFFREAGDYIRVYRHLLKEIAELPTPDTTASTVGVLHLNELQEFAKSGQLPVTAEVHLKLLVAGDVADGIVKMTKGFFLSSGKKYLLSAIPAKSKRRSFDARVGYLEAIDAIAKKYPDVPGIDREGFGRMVSELRNLKVEQHHAGKASKPVTQELHRALKGTTRLLVAWVEAIRAAAKVLGNDEAIQKAPTLPVSRHRGNGDPANRVKPPEPPKP